MSSSNEGELNNYLHTNVPPLFEMPDSLSNLSAQQEKEKQVDNVGNASRETAPTVEHVEEEQEVCNRGRDGTPVDHSRLREVDLNDSDIARIGAFTKA